MTHQDRLDGRAGTQGLDDEQTRARLAAEDAAATSGPGARPWLLEGLKAREAFLERTVEYLREGQGKEDLSHAAEWMLDNFYLAQQSLRQVREDMPASFYRQLPKLVAGPLQGYPRIYDLAQRLVADSDARLEMEAVRRFVALYQGVRPLTIGEIWALPVMLRWSILSILTRAAGDITGLAPPVDGLREPVVRPLVDNLSGDEVVANCFTSLRTMTAFDWRDFFESVSQVEQALRADPPDVYAHMDRSTRDRYRRVVEELALESGHGEEHVAGTAVALARDAYQDLPPAKRTPLPARDGADEPEWRGFDAPPSAHVGYYLVDNGREALEERLGFRPALHRRLARKFLRHPFAVYTGLVAMLALFVLMAAAIYAAAQGGSAFLIMLAAVVTLMPALAAAIAFVDWVVTLVVPPRVLPKLNLSEPAGGGRIPDACRTLVVVPALISNARDVASLLRQIEQHYLRNRDENVHFALLTDFADADEQHMPRDAELLEQQRAGITLLNERYAASEDAPAGATEGPFCMFHRERRWNDQESQWIGWERKRGKLHELNRWLRGATDTSIVSSIGPPEDLRGVKYIITLDSDTILGRDGARSLIATLAHPLNRAQADPRTGRVRGGYGLLQPRTEVTPSSANYSRFSRIFAGDIGLDLYTNAVSNVYQDLFGSGIYVGKGIYDLDAFENSLAGRVPENTLLSHDLFEGIHARVGLVTDIVLYEEYPRSYLAHMRRLHRWTRGDWQLLPWLLPAAFRPKRLPKFEADFELIDIWKLLDNLRRSLLAPALLLMLVAGWLFLPGSAAVWTIAALAALAVPPLTGALTPLARGPSRKAWRQAASSLKAGL
ncbi:MAG: carbohydrate-binding protein, partial [Polyangiaceae bacterium]|nr:carbohydrate-binding protein [Polyangiaceae bacterium]